MPKEMYFEVYKLQKAHATFLNRWWGRYWRWQRTWKQGVI